MLLLMLLLMLLSLMFFVVDVVVDVNVVSVSAVICVAAGFFPSCWRYRSCLCCCTFVLWLLELLLELNSTICGLKIV